MAISFEYPIMCPHPDNPKDTGISYREGIICPINLVREPYEITLNAHGYSFHLILGKQINGVFLCIPNWQFGCEFSRLSDQFWNLKSILEKDSLLDYEDAAAITYALDFVSSLIN